jgi:hypothetical protein
MILRRPSSCVGNESLMNHFSSNDHQIECNSIRDTT